MLEYFTYKKVKKHRAEKKAHEPIHSPLLDDEDERFLTRIVSAEGTPPPLPERPHGLGVEAGDSTGNASQMVLHDGREGEEMKHRHHKDKGKGKAKEYDKDTKNDSKKSNRFSFLSRMGSKKEKALSPNEKVVSPNEALSEEDDINKILDDLNLSAVNNRAFSVSKESQEIVQKFTVILKDLVNGVPTAYDDLVSLLNDSQGTLEKSYDHLPSFLKKLIAQLPSKMTGNLAPELLAVAAEAQAFSGGEAAAGAAAAGGIGGAAKSFLKVSTLKDLVTKPGAVISMLKAIMNFLKLRFPAFMGTNVLLSLGLFVLLFVFWYCHKRGKETRLERERTVDSNGRIVELDEDPMLESSASRPTSHRSASHSHRSSSRRESERQHRRSHSHNDRHLETPDHRHESRSEHVRREDREHGYSSSSSHEQRRSGASTPTRSHTEKRPVSSRQGSERHGSSRRRGSEDGGRERDRSDRERERERERVDERRR